MLETVSILRKEKKKKKKRGGAQKKEGCIRRDLGEDNGNFF
jgi:hypothetical protein